MSGRDRLSEWADDGIRLREAFASIAERARPTADCPEPTRLWAALCGELPAGARREMVDHLSSCPACAEAWRLARELAPAVEGRGVAEGWTGRIASLFGRPWAWSPAASATSASWARPRPALAFAATFVAAVGLGISTFQLQRQNQRLVSVGSEREARMASLEADNRRLQDNGSRLEAELRDFRLPQPNAIIFDLFSVEWRERSGAERAVPEIKVPPGARSYVLVLSGEGQERAGEHVVEIRDREGKTVWRGEGLRRDPQGNFTLTLDRSFLRDGEYRFVLYGRRGNELSRLAQYAVRVRQE